MNEDLQHELEFLQALTEVEGKALAYGPGSLSFEQLMRMRKKMTLELVAPVDGHHSRAVVEHVGSFVQGVSRPRPVLAPGPKKKQKQIAEAADPDDGMGQTTEPEWSADEIRQTALKYALAHDGVLTLMAITPLVPDHYRHRVGPTINAAVKRFGLFKNTAKGEYRLTATGRKAAEKGGASVPVAPRNQNQHQKTASTAGKPDGITNSEWLRREVMAFAARHSNSVRMPDFNSMWRKKYPEAADSSTLGVHGALSTMVRQGLAEVSKDDGVTTYRFKEKALAASA